MLNLLIMPSSPALAEELSPADAPSRALLGAARQLVREYASANEELVLDIVGSRDARWHTAHTGSLRAWGAPSVELGEGNYLPELMARYMLAGGPDYRVGEVREHLGTPRAGVLTIVCIDGSAGLTQRAPLALIDAAPAAARWCESLLAGADESCDEEKLRAAGVEETVLWAELAALRPLKAELRAADSTLGVGRYVAGWQC